MKSTLPERILERTLLALESTLIEASDEEVLDAARMLGMDPSMKASAAYFGVTMLARRHDRIDDTRRQKTPTRDRRRTKRDVPSSP